MAWEINLLEQIAFVKKKKKKRPYCSAAKKERIGIISCKSFIQRYVFCVRVCGHVRASIEGHSAKFVCYCGLQYKNVWKALLLNDTFPQATSVWALPWWVTFGVHHPSLSPGEIPTSQESRVWEPWLCSLISLPHFKSLWVSPWLQNYGFIATRHSSCSITQSPCLRG